MYTLPRRQSPYMAPPSLQVSAWKAPMCNVQDITELLQVNGLYRLGIHIGLVGVRLLATHRAALYFLYHGMELCLISNEGDMVFGRADQQANQGSDPPLN